MQTFEIYVACHETEKLNQPIKVTYGFAGKPQILLESVPRGPEGYLTPWGTIHAEEHAWCL